MQVPVRVLPVILAAALSGVAQQIDRPSVREESTTPEQFRKAHAPLVKGRDTATDAATPVGASDAGDAAIRHDEVLYQ